MLICAITWASFQWICLTLMGKVVFWCMSGLRLLSLRLHTTCSPPPQSMSHSAPSAHLKSVRWELLEHRAARRKIENKFQHCSQFTVTSGAHPVLNYLKLPELKKFLIQQYESGLFVNFHFILYKLCSVDTSWLRTQMICSFGGSSGRRNVNWVSVWYKLKTVKRARLTRRFCFHAEIIYEVLSRFFPKYF